MLGKRFRVITDQRALKYLLDHKVVSGEYQKCILKLYGYDFEILYRPRKENGAADALSRRGDGVRLSELVVSHTSNKGDLLLDLKPDRDVLAMNSLIEAGDEKMNEYEIRDGLVFYQNRLVLPSHSSWIDRLFQEAHAGVMGGHEGIKKILSLINTRILLGWNTAGRGGTGSQMWHLSTK